MNVYDFDDTIYKGDSTLDFYIFCLKKKPKLIFYLPKQIIGFTKYIFNFIGKKEFKEYFYSFLNGIENVDLYINDFWEKNKIKIKLWYLENKKTNDVIISASPEFLLAPICNELGIESLICSKVDKYSAKHEGENCYGEEKVTRYKEIYCNKKIDNFYSDSLSDEPLAKISKNSYIVLGDKLVKWKNYEPSKITKMKKMFLSTEFIVFIFIGIVNTFNGILFAFLYSLLCNANLAFILGYMTSLTISYLLNSFITFKENLSIKKYIKFCISYIPNFIIQNVIVFIILNLLDYHRLIAYSCAALIGLPITFLMLKIFTFNKK